MSEPLAKKGQVVWPKRWALMTPFSLFLAARDRLCVDSWNPPQATELARRSWEHGYEGAHYLYSVLANHCPENQHSLCQRFDADAAEGNVWGKYFSGTLCETCHTHTREEKEHGCPLLVEAALAGNVEAQAELSDHFVPGSDPAVLWAFVAAQKGHPVALMNIVGGNPRRWTPVHRSLVRLAVEMGYYWACYMSYLSYSTTDIVTAFRFLLQTVQQTDLFEEANDKFAHLIQRQIEAAFERQYLQGNRSHAILRDMIRIVHVLKLMFELDHSMPIVQVFDRWCFRAQTATLCWVWVWKNDLLAVRIPAEMAFMIARMVWDSRYDPSCGWDAMEQKKLIQ